MENTTPVIPTAPQTPLPPLAHSPKPFPLRPILALIGVVSLALTGFFIYQNSLLNQKLQTLIKAQQASIVTPTPAPTDETASWKTYSNSELGFEFKYPPTLEEKGSISGGPSAENLPSLLTLSDPSTGAEGTDKPFNGLSIYYVISSQTSLQQFVANEKKSMITMTKSFDGIDTSNQGKQWSLTIGDKEAFGLQGYIPFSITYYYVQLKKGYLIFAVSEESKGRFTKTVDQMLSTFKFSTAATIPPDWKTYTNTKYGYSFKYPNNYTVGTNGMDFGNVSEEDGILVVETNKGDLKAPYISIGIINLNGQSINKEIEDHFSKVSQFKLTDEAKKMLKEQNGFEAVDNSVISPATKSTFVGQASTEYSIHGSMVDDKYSGIVSIPNTYRYIWVQKQGLNFLITISKSDITDKILSTFKFTGK